MNQHPITGMMDTSMEKIRQMVDVNTIIGDPIACPDGTTIIPVSKVSFGFAAGGSDWPSKQPKELFGGGTGAGISIQPIAFLVVANGEVKILRMEATPSPVAGIVDAIPNAINTITDMIGKSKDKKAKAAEGTEENIIAE